METEISTQTAAKIIGLSPNQIRLHLESGKLKGRRLNPRTWLVDREAAENFEKPPKGRPKQAIGRKALDLQPEDLVDELGDLAKELGETRSALTARILRDGIDSERKKLKRKK